MTVRLPQPLLRLCVHVGLWGILLLLAASCHKTGRSSGQGRGVLLIAVDGLRADHLLTGGYDRDTAPFLCGLMGSSVSFSQTFSSAPFALAACVSLLTGCDPMIAKRYIPSGFQARPSLLWNIPKDAPRIAQEFLRAGYATAAFVDDPTLSKLAGFEAGFQRYVVPQREGWNERHGMQELAPQLEQWIASLGRRQDWFAVLHISDLERAFAKPDPIWNEFFAAREEWDAVPPISDSSEVFFAVPKSRWTGAMQSLGEIEATYDGAIRKFDGELERFLALALSDGRDERTTIAVVGTHGMSLGESGLIASHGRLCDPDLHVPLAIRPRAGVSYQAGASRSALVSLVDLAPTLLELEDLPRPPAMQGFSLLPLLTDASAAVREYAFASHGFQAGWVAMNASWCFESVRPDAAKTKLLATSWIGCEPARLGNGPTWHNVLHDRTKSHNLGHLIAQEGDLQLAERMRAMIRTHEQACEALRSVLQRSDRFHTLGNAEQPAVEINRAFQPLPQGTQGP